MKVVAIYYELMYISSVGLKPDKDNSNVGIVFFNGDKSEVETLLRQDRNRNRWMVLAMEDKNADEVAKKIKTHVTDGKSTTRVVTRPDYIYISTTKGTEIRDPGQKYFFDIESENDNGRPYGFQEIRAGLKFSYIDESNKMTSHVLQIPRFEVGMTPNENNDIAGSVESVLVLKLSNKALNKLKSCMDNPHKNISIIDKLFS